jgi:glycosyltransferase involved in cell wall biosynthesis
MNILMMNYDLDVGGQEAHVVGLCKYLLGRGHHVRLWTKGGTLEAKIPPSVHHKVSFDLLAPWPLRRRIKSQFIQGLRSFRQELIKVLTSDRVDIVHCHGVTETILARAALGRRSVPLVYSSHGWPDEMWDWHLRYLRRCDHYIAVCRFTFDKLTSYGVDAKRISEIPYGIEYAPKPDRTVVSRLRQELLAGRADGCIIVTVARLHRQKGHDILLRAIPNVLMRHPQTVFLFVGDGPELEALKKLASQLNIANVVHFRGMHSDVSPFLSASDIFCLPSRYEALPLAIPEAYRAGLPVVVCRVAGCPEIVRDGITGFLVEKEAPDALAEALNQLIGNPQLRRKLASKAEEYGHLPRFSPEVIHLQIEDLYAELIRKRPTRFGLTAFEITLGGVMRIPFFHSRQ